MGEKGGVYGINENKQIGLFAINGVYRGRQGPFIPFMVRAAAAGSCFEIFSS
jgi:hypothetical protein